MKKSKNKHTVIRMTNADSDSLKHVHVYLFDESDQLMEIHPLAKGKVTLQLSPQQIKQHYTLLLAPGVPESLNKERLKIHQLKQFGAFEPTLLFDRDNHLDIDYIPDWGELLPFFRCLITGNVSKDFMIDGVSTNLPVCEARVHICEVDRISWIIPRIPDLVLDDLLERLRDRLIPEINPPIPDIGPEVIRPPRDFSLNLSENLSVNRLKRIRKSQPLHSLSQSEITPTITRNLFSSSKLIARQTLINHFDLFHPIICRWPFFWPYFYRCQHIATVYTDCHGKFNHQYYSISQDRDIYVWIEVNVNGEWITVYKPSKACGTRWNYDCGSDINIKITDERVAPCDCSEQLEGDIVWFQSIGHHAHALKIEQNPSSTELVQGTALSNVGCVSTSYESKQINPFGKQLSFKVLFGDGFPNEEITHYRWTKKQLKNAALLNVSGSKNVVGGNVRKNYYIITNDGGVTHFETRSVDLGPVGTGEGIGYRIPSWNVYDDEGVPADDKSKTIQWTSPNFFSMSIDSNSLSNGLWEFELELGRMNDGQFQPVNVDKEVFQVSQLSNTGSSQPAPNAYLNLASVDEARALKLNVRIDNSPCVAQIFDTTIQTSEGIKSSGVCGFLHYENRSQLTRLRFEASHPREFATFSYVVVKGNGTDSPGINADGYVISSVDGYTLIGNEFHRQVSVDTLLGSCQEASFAERLYVTALATNGTDRIREYDASDLESFALSMKSS